MKNKLVLIFADICEVPGIEKALLFNNELDAEEYLLSTGKIKSIKIETEDRWFSFKTDDWEGNGRAYWAKDKT